MQFLPSLIKRVALFCAAFLVMGSVAVAFLLATGPGRSLTAGLINNVASSEAQKVEITGLTSLLATTLKLSKLFFRIAKAFGPQHKIFRSTMAFWT